MNAWLGVSVILGCLGLNVFNTGKRSLMAHPLFMRRVLALYALLLRFTSFVIPIEVEGSRKITALDLSTSLRMTKAFFAVVFSGALSYVTYDLSFVFINNFVPYITNISKATMMSWNSYLLIFDMLLFIPIAYIAHRLNVFKTKRLATWMLALPAIPMFYFMKDASFYYVILIRVWIVFWGVVFSCVYTIWILRLFPHKSKYLWIAWA